MIIKESGENYLETILILSERKNVVRSIDIAKELGFSKPSVSRAVSILRNEGYITTDFNMHITLTEKGYEYASSVYDKHKTISKFLKEVLEIDDATAAKDACRMEHILSDITFARLKAFTSCYPEKVAQWPEVLASPEVTLEETEN